MMRCEPKGQHLAAMCSILGPVLMVRCGGGRVLIESRRAFPRGETDKPWVVVLGMGELSKA